MTFWIIWACMLSLVNFFGICLRRSEEVESWLRAADMVFDEECDYPNYRYITNPISWSEVIWVLSHLVIIPVASVWADIRGPAPSPLAYLMNVLILIDSVAVAAFLFILVTNMSPFKEFEAKIWKFFSSPAPIPLWRKK